MDPQPEPRKALGQHFLSDPGYCRRIVSLAQVSAGDPVLEIGPGTGVLTERLLAAGAIVRAVELDSRLVEYLTRRLAQPIAQERLFLVQGDVLRLDWHELTEPVGPAGGPDSARRVKLVANLPYNIATRILSRTTPFANRFHSLTVMTQKEVALRVTARPGSRDYGYLSLLMEYHYRVGSGFDVPPGAFSPPPKVVSRVFQLLPLDPPRAFPSYAGFLKLVSAGFRHRRKTLWKNLLAAGYPEDRLRAAFEAAGLPFDVRAEAVPLARFLALADVLSFGA
ncbi:MAG: 16S rRNA (adenine(1518)-N(6)/adenine(1519)-N(6)) -dimethyltransferase RsmA [Acidobacteriota bacterium]